MKIKKFAFLLTATFFGALLLFYNVILTPSDFFERYAGFSSSSIAAPLLFNQSISLDSIKNESITNKSLNNISIPSFNNNTNLIYNETVYNNNNNTEKLKNATLLTEKYELNILPQKNSTLSITSMVPENATALQLCPLTPPNLVGRLRTWMDGPSMAKLINLYPDLGKGGHSKPKDCISRHRVAIIIAYRDRESHLRVLLHNLHAILQRQQLDYTIFVIEQLEGQTFNRGKLMNVGFAEASKLYDWQCFIFHDVDLIPEDDRNIYSCPEIPRHMSVAVDKFNYQLPYSDIFGGISALTKKQYTDMNGFSNDYWGWGGEDDDISIRISLAGYRISRYPLEIARYKMIKHTRDSKNPVNNCRYTILKNTRKRWRNDGLVNLNYNVTDIEFHPLFTRIKVDLLEEQSRKLLKAQHLSDKC